jgi:ribosome-associated protein
MDNEAADKSEPIEIREEPIDLVKLLKLDHQVSGGGEAKILLAEGGVRLNGEVETRKRKKVYHDDVVEYRGRVLRVVLSADPSHDA